MINEQAYEKLSNWPMINQSFMVVDETALIKVWTYFDSAVSGSDDVNLINDCQYMLDVLEEDYASIIGSKDLFNYYASLMQGSSKLIELFYVLAKTRLTSVLTNGLLMPSSLKHKYDPDIKFEPFINFVYYYLKKKVMTRNNNAWFLHMNLCPSEGLGRAIFSRKSNADLFPNEPFAKTKEDDLIWYATIDRWTRVDKGRIIQAYGVIQDYHLSKMDLNFLDCLNSLTFNEVLYYKTKWKC